MPTKVIRGSCYTNTNTNTSTFTSSKAKSKTTSRNIKTRKTLRGGNNWSYLPLKLVNALEPVAEYYNVSHKARGLQKPTKSDKGFLQVYREAGGVPSKFEKLPVRTAKQDGENWQHHRADFCNRRYAMIKGKPGYGLYDEKTGLPSVMHVNGRILK